MGKPSLELTKPFLKLKKKLKEHRKGTWVWANRAMRSKYSNLIITQLALINNENNEFFEYKGEAIDLDTHLILNMKLFQNYVSISTGESEHEADAYLDVVAAIAGGTPIKLADILYNCMWEFNKSENYIDLTFN
mgnify:FL=1